MIARSRAGRLGGSVWAPSPGSAHDDVDDAEVALVGGGHPHRQAAAVGGLVGGPPQDRRAALGADDRVDRVLEGHDHVADGDRERAARAALAGDDGDDRRPQAGHQRRSSGRSPRPCRAPRTPAPGWAPGHVDEGHDRQAEPLGQLHHPHRLAIALGVGHAEVAPDVLVGLGALLLADDHDRPTVDPSRGRRRSPGRRRRGGRRAARRSRRIMAVEELEGPRPVQVACELDPRPGSRVGGSGVGRLVSRRLRLPPTQALNHGAPRLGDPARPGHSGTTAAGRPGCCRCRWLPRPAGWAPAGRPA